MSRIDDGRAELVAYLNERPSNVWAADVNLQRVLATCCGADELARWQPILELCGARVAGPLEAAAMSLAEDANLPRLEGWSAAGEHTATLWFPADRGQIRRAALEAGIMGGYEEPGQQRFQMAALYLLSHLGESGVTCPLACTAGLIRLLAREGTAEQRRRHLPGLRSRDPEDCLIGAQFLTEVQGGSDVGANDTIARRHPDRPDSWLLTGEKWFCSVADADLFVLTARPDTDSAGGTAGLGLFLVPRRRADGTPNGFRIRQLKRKIGTRALATAEIDFLDAEATAIGPLDRGFRNMVEVVLNTSRLYNAVAACGIMAKATLEAGLYARHRSAFGASIACYPAVAETLARMRTLTWASVSSTFALVTLEDELALGHRQADGQAIHRLLVNMNKYWTAILCTRVTRDAIEILGGNGTIEAFSLVPTLYRDAIVLETWEGTHNVLCAQIVRDLHKYRFHEPFLAHLGALLAGVSHAPDGLVSEAREALAASASQLERLLGCAPEQQAFAMRPAIDALAVAHATCTLLSEHDAALAAGEEDGKGDVIRHLAASCGLTALDPFDEETLRRVQRIAALA